MEIMGLAIIVILVSVGILFAIRFVVLREPASYKQGYTQSELASNLLSSMLRITAKDCRSMSFTEVFQHCTRNPSTVDLMCKHPDRTTCQFIEHEVKDLFNQTLNAWSIRYEFIARTSSRDLFRDGEECPRGFKSKQYPIPVDPTGQNTLFVILNICD